jgi:hypothetical protein
MRAGVDVIRIGLQADEGLNLHTVLAGCWHPSLGQMVRSELYGDLLCQMISGVPDSLPLAVKCHPGRVSDVIGPAKVNLGRLELRGRNVHVAADSGLAEEELLVEINKVGERDTLKGSIVTDLHYSIHEV